MSQIAYLFAGQGAQYVGMGKSLCDAYPDIQSQLQPHLDSLGIPLMQTCFQGPEDLLTNTEYAQPGIYWVSWLAKLALEKELPQLNPNATAGLSLGEFTALAAGNVFSFENGLKIVHQRGKAMQEACEAAEGGMAAIIGLKEDVLGALCESEGVTMANLNCPGQVVVSGPKEKVNTICEKAKGEGAKRALPLQVAGAYHSPLMAPAAKQLESVIQGVDFQDSEVTVLSNVTGRPHQDSNSIKEKLVEQVTASVRWESCMRNLIENGTTTFVELGPGKALSGFMKRIDKSVRIVQVEDKDSLDKAVEVLSEIA